MALDKLIQRRCQRVEVGAESGGFTLQHFWRDMLGRVGLGGAARHGVHAGDAEVAQLRLSVFTDQKICGLHIAMSDTGGVSGFKG